MDSRSTHLSLAMTSDRTSLRRKRDEGVWCDMKSSHLVTWSLAICMICPALACAEWNGTHHLGRWFGYGFGDGYHSCPCPASCGSAAGCNPLSLGYPVAIAPRYETGRDINTRQIDATAPSRFASIWTTSALPTFHGTPAKTVARTSPPSETRSDPIRSAQQQLPMIRRLPN